MDDIYIEKFYDEICNTLEGDYKIILEPGRELEKDWIEYDRVKWELEEPIQSLVKALQSDNTLSFEEKVLGVYKCICLNYIYDDNVLFFFKKNISDIDNPKYIAVDWYGRIVGERWIENRKKHNRRVCYEFARFYAKAINELLDKNEELEAVMVGDKENLHYFVGLTGDKYSILLDLDDFNKIKDLTRLKLGMTIDGITIIRDESRIFENAVKEFNSNRLTELPEVTEAREIKNKDDLIPYFKSIVEILRNHNIDSQGFMEFMKSIIESEEIEVEKVWKKIDGEEKRYVRCLIFEYNNETYLLDSVDKILFSKDKDDLDRDSFVLNPAENEYPYFGG